MAESVAEAVTKSLAFDVNMAVVEIVAAITAVADTKDVEVEDKDTVCLGSRFFF